MYYLIYGLLYLLSLMPWRVLYFIGDCIYVLAYYVIGYRKKVVFANLIIAFPEKTVQERMAIAREFYHNFIDTFIETLKFISISDKEFSKRVSGNFDLLAMLHKSGKSVQLHSGHFFNWEFMNWAIAKYSPYTFIGVYLEIPNKALNKIMLNLRGRYNTLLVSTYTFKNSFHTLAKEQYALGLAADQNAHPEKGYWVRFFGKLTPFVTGPEKGAHKNDTAVVFVHYYKVKRGFYHGDFELFTTEPTQFKTGEITKKYVSYLEDCIRKKPANYLWSHRRWKHEFKEEYRNNLYE
jgi:KDO2-lipid IV(A) lauroyltransferase